MCSNPASTRSSSGRQLTTQPTARTSSPAGNCNAPTNPSPRCDGYVRINDTQQFGFNTLSDPTVKLTLPLQPKAIHDEMNATNFDEFGRMQAVLGVEAQPPVPGAQNFVAYPFVNPPTEIIDATNLPKTGCDLRCERPAGQ